VTDARRQRLWQLGAAGAFAAILVAVAIVVSQAGSDSLKNLPEDTRAVQSLFGGIQEDGKYLGSPDAKATLVEYADLQCPFCREFTVDVLPTIVKRYVRPGDLRLRLELQTFIGAQSEPAARVALCASLQNRMWQFADVFYRNQDDENSGYVTPQFLQAIADATPGLDAQKALAAEDSPPVTRLLDQSKALFTDGGLTSTPSFEIEQGDVGHQLDISDPSDTGEFTSQLDSLTGH
jgi:protein-disulfide isomerase